MNFLWTRNSHLWSFICHHPRTSYHKRNTDIKLIQLAFVLWKGKLTCRNTGNKQDQWPTELGLTKTVCKSQHSSTALVTNKGYANCVDQPISSKFDHMLELKFCSQHCRVAVPCSQIKFCWVYCFLRLSNLIYIWCQLTLFFITWGK